jgi:hypothetical protein
MSLLVRKDFQHEGQVWPLWLASKGSEEPMIRDLDWAERLGYASSVRFDEGVKWNVLAKGAELGSAQVTVWACSWRDSTEQERAALAAAGARPRSCVLIR